MGHIRYDDVICYDYVMMTCKIGVVELAGDMLESDSDVIIHCCNCFHTMGAGAAKTIK